MPRQLTPDHEALVERLAASGAYGDADHVIGEALRLLDDRFRLQQLRAKLQVGLASGEGIELTPEYMDRLEREAEEAYQRGEQPNPDACP